MSENNPNLIVISIDSLNSIDLDFIKNLPTFNSFIQEGSIIKKVECVYPSVTYTCHTSIITGTYPNKHNIYCNELFNPNNFNKQEWFWYEKDIRVPTLFDYAHQAGLITANVLWPVMAGSQITYNCPEIWSVTGKSFLSLFLKYGTRSLLPLLIKHRHKFKGKEQPYLDNFVEAISKDIIIKKKPNLTCIHFIELDHVRHVHGLKSEKTKEVLIRLDKRISNIINATKEANIYENTSFVLLGDHGCNDFKNIVYLNSYLFENGFITLNNKGQVIDWKVYANSCGGSAQIHINDNCNSEDIKKINDALGKLTVMPNTFIKKFYTKEEVNSKYNLDGNLNYVIEAKEGYIFRNDFSNTLIKNREDIPGSYKAEHGYEPTQDNLYTILLAKGNKIKKGVALENASIVDEGPSLAKILGLEMKKVDGKVLREILEI